MKKFTLAALAALTTLISCNMNNPLLTASDAPYGAPAFDKINNSHYKSAFEASIAEARSEIDAIVANPDAPTFANTIEALERSGRTLSDVGNIFFNLNEACTNDEMQSIAEEVSPMLTEFSMYVMLNEKLFERVKAVYEQRSSLSLEPYQAKLLEDTYKSFSRNGANLSPEAKAEYAKVAEELSLTTLAFGKNVLAATNAFAMNVTDEADLEGLPDFVRTAAAEEAANRGEKGWTFTLKAPSYRPFLKYSAVRSLREKIWRAYNTQCIRDEYDNTENIRKIVGLRLREANLLGYATFADYVLEERMARNSATVNEFLANMQAKAYPAGARDVKEIERYARANGLEGSLMPWDFSYWSDKLQKEKYDLSDEMLKPYFRLENVQAAIFDLANRLYGLNFKENADIPVYHPDVKAFEVTGADGRFMALLYIDYFPRESKRGGAWMTEFREMYTTADGVEVRPFISLVTNFTKPTADTPSLLTFDEFTTILHEFGHALHGMLAEGVYASQTGTSVTRDFVELPSQIMENWAYEPEYLKTFAKHYQTGEVIPQELIDRIIAAQKYLAGYSCIRQLNFGIVDMAWHSAAEVPATDPVIFEQEIVAKAPIIPAVEGTSFSHQFNHIFSGGYAAGYYSYKWAEVLEADAFSLFKEKGIFNREVAESFRREILSKGSSEDADVLYRNFRGRDPKPDALFEKMGMK